VIESVFSGVLEVILRLHAGVGVLEVILRLHAGVLEDPMILVLRLHAGVLEDSMILAVLEELESVLPVEYSVLNVSSVLDVSSVSPVQYSVLDVSSVLDVEPSVLDVEPSVLRFRFALSPWACGSPLDSLNFSATLAGQGIAKVFCPAPLQVGVVGRGSWSG
jgi:hypothetical protein